MTTFSYDTEPQTRQQTIMNDSDRSHDGRSHSGRADSAQPSTTDNIVFSRRQHIGEPTLLLKVTVKLD